MYDVLLATARLDEQGRLVSTEPLYRFLLDRFGIPDPQSRRVRTRAVRELADRGLVRRLTVRGPGVEVLVQARPDDEALSYEDYADAADDDLDTPAVASRRKEQAFLRRVLLRGREEGECVFCGRVLPAELLAAAHLKRRAELSREERLRFRQVAALACTLGCDALYELGYLTVDDDLRVLTASVTAGYLSAHLAGLSGRRCPRLSDADPAYLAEHRRTRSRG